VYSLVFQVVLALVVLTHPIGTSFKTPTMILISQVQTRNASNRAREFFQGKTASTRITSIFRRARFLITYLISRQLLEAEAVKGLQTAISIKTQLAQVVAVQVRAQVPCSQFWGTPIRVV